MKSPWLWNLLSIVALVVGLVVWVLLPWYGVLAAQLALRGWHVTVLDAARGRRDAAAA